METTTTKREKALTADEYLKQAYERIISIGNAVIEFWPKITYNVLALYRFSYDKLAIYKFIKTFHDGSSTFERLSDGATLRMTKYSERPEIIIN